MISQGNRVTAGDRDILATFPLVASHEWGTRNEIKKTEVPEVMCLFRLLAAQNRVQRIIQLILRLILLIRILLIPLLGLLSRQRSDDSRHTAMCELAWIREAGQHVFHLHIRDCLHVRRDVRRVQTARDQHRDDQFAVLVGKRGLHHATDTVAAH